jgi:hypothetical protein
VAHRGRETADAALIAALAGGATVQDAAKAAGVSPRTAHRRLDDRAFKIRVQAARAELVEHAVGILAKASTAAAVTLAQLLDKNIAPSTRLAAARAILELGSKLRETQELGDRIAALEERVDQQGAARWAS